MKDISKKDKHKMAVCRFKIRQANKNSTKQNIAKKCDTCTVKFACLTRYFTVRDILVPRWTFDVPNDDEGREFIRLAKKYLPDSLKLIPRGRAKNRISKGGNSNWVPAKTADRFVVYIHTIWSDFWGERF